jgi:hypothetical protein
MVGTIMGVMKGEKWIRSQGWKIKDEYRNDRRPGLPTDLSITDFADLHYRVAKRVILEHGGNTTVMPGSPGFRIMLQEPANVEILPDPLNRIGELRNEWRSRIHVELSGDSIEMARAVYLAVCLDLVEEMSDAAPEKWINAVGAFRPYYGPLFGNDQWNDKAKAYFNDVINNGNMQPDFPFGYD